MREAWPKEWWSGLQGYTVGFKWGPVKLNEALPIIMLFYDPRAALHDDHICIQKPPHTLAQCSHGADEVYTETDAVRDGMPDTLLTRLRDGGTLKPA